MQGKTIALRIVSVVLVVICMGAIFMFSAEDAAKSDSTSKGTIIALAGVIKKISIKCRSSKGMSLLPI